MIDFFANSDAEQFDGAYLMTWDAIDGEAFIPDSLYQRGVRFSSMPLPHRGNLSS